MAESEDTRDEGEQPDGHAVPTEDAREIAGSAEDAALEAYEEAEEATVDVPPAEPQAQQDASASDGEPAAPAPAAEVHEAHAVPTEEAREIAGSAEDAALEAYEQAEDAAAETQGEDAAAETQAEDEEWEEAPAPREKPAVPGAHLEVDIVPEGVDPLGRGEAQEYVDPYAIVEAEDVVVEDAEEPAEAEEEEVLTEPISTAAIDLASGARYRATGKRKTAIARVTLRPGSGTYLINGRTLEEHFPRLTLQRNIRQPLETVGYQERMDVVARLHGGGISAQAGALRHGVSRALLEADPNLRGELKRRGFLTRDSRAKERKKAGLKKARKRPQFSKR
jgi:small subunit ribosomal protein S9